MTKADVINEIVEKTGVARRDVAVTVEAFMEVIKNKMVNEREDWKEIYHYCSCRGCNYKRGCSTS